MDHGSVFDTTGDPLAQFRRALPARAARLLVVLPLTVRALGVCVARGDDLGELAARCSRGLEHRSETDVRSLLLFRVCREAGLSDELMSESRND
jgi:hypothetical protein